MTNSNNRGFIICSQVDVASGLAFEQAYYAQVGYTVLLSNNLIVVIQKQ